MNQSLKTPILAPLKLRCKFAMNVITSLLIYSILVVEVNTLYISSNKGFQIANKKIEGTWILDNGRVETRQLDCCLVPTLCPTNIIRAKFIDQNFGSLQTGFAIDMPKLNFISFKNNQLTRINSQAFINLESLEEINLGSNELEMIDERAFHNLPALRTIKLQDNQIRILKSSTFSNLQRLTNVFLPDNNLKTWDKTWFTNTPSLEVIVLSRNNIRHLPVDAFPAKIFPALIQVDLSDNRLKRLYNGSFKSNGIKILNLAYNGLQHIAPNLFNGCNNLQTLFLHGNKLTYLPDNFLKTYWKSLKELTVYGNPWRCACYKNVINWATERKISLDLMNYGCMNKNNPVCIHEVDHRSLKDFYEEYDPSHEDRICIGSSVIVPATTKMIRSNEW